MRRSQIADRLINPMVTFCILYNFCTWPVKQVCLWFVNFAGTRKKIIRGLGLVLELELVPVSVVFFFGNQRSLFAARGILCV